MSFLREYDKAQLSYYIAAVHSICNMLECFEVLISIENVFKSVRIDSSQKLTTSPGICGRYLDKENVILGAWLIFIWSCMWMRSYLRCVDRFWFISETNHFHWNTRKIFWTCPDRYDILHYFCSLTPGNWATKKHPKNQKSIYFTILVE